MGLAATFRKSGGRYKLASSHGEDLAHVFSPVSGGTEVRSLLQSVKDNPDALFVFRISTRPTPTSSRAS